MPRFLSPSKPRNWLSLLSNLFSQHRCYYDHAYDVRAKIHKYASFATLPLVGGEFVVGQSLFDSPSDWKKSAHVAIGTAIGGLFAVNSVTGVWNLVEARKDPNRGHLPLIHGLLALGADAGFVATAAITPGGTRRRFFESRRQGHASHVSVHVDGSGHGELPDHAHWKSIGAFKSDLAPRIMKGPLHAIQPHGEVPKWS